MSPGHGQCHGAFLKLLLLAPEAEISCRLMELEKLQKPVIELKGPQAICIQEISRKIIH